MKTLSFALMLLLTGCANHPQAAQELPPAPLPKATPEMMLPIPEPNWFPNQLKEILRRFN